MPSKYIKTGMTPEGTEKRLRAHRHNGYTGHARMMQKQCWAISDSDSTTSRAKELSEEIAHLAHELEIALKQRVDP